MAASSASSSSSSSSSATTLPSMDKAAAHGGADPAADCGVCAICLDRIALQETALVKGCDHAYCTTCILRWASYKQTPLCPQCKHPFEFLSVHRSLDGCIHDYLFEESVCLLLRAAWFEPLTVEAHEEAPEEDELYHQYQYDDDEDDIDEEIYYMSRSPSIRIGNRRWGDNGYIRGGRREARPRSAQNDSADVCPSRTPKKKEAAAASSGSGSGSARTPKKKKEVSPSGSGSASISKDVAGRRAKRAQKREAADKAAAEKHLKHLLRLGLSKAPEVPVATG